MSARARVTVAWDVDDVLNLLTRACLDLRARESKVDVAYDALVDNPPHAQLGVPRERYLASLDDFRRNHFASLAPNPLAIDWFRQHGAAADHIALTAVPLAFAPTSAAWVLRHFGAWIRGVHVVPSPRDDDPTAFPAPNKGLALSRFHGPTILVDDSPTQLALARQHGSHAVTYPQPWNQEARSPREVLAELTTLIQRISSS
ncbi:MAG: hypothetical protein ACHREM_11670 [Polyangiales bacterium]